MTTERLVRELMRIKRCMSIGDIEELFENIVSPLTDEDRRLIYDRLLEEYFDFIEE